MSDERPTQAGNPWSAQPPPNQPGHAPPGPPPGPPPGYPPGPPPGYGPGFPPGPPPGPPRRSRLPLVLGVVAAVLVLGVAVTVPIVLSGDDDEPSSQATDDPSEESSGDQGGEAPADLSEVREYEDLPTTHVEDPITYEQSPPVGGEHYPAWIECGVYDEPVPNEFAVHDLEHGTFWFTYDADALAAEDVEQLAAQLPENGLMSPYEGLDAPVVVTVWGRQLALTGADDPRLPLFLDEYADGETAPEPFASCAGGVSPDEAAGLVGA